MANNNEATLDIFHLHTRHKMYLAHSKYRAAPTICHYLFERKALPLAITSINIANGFKLTEVCLLNKNIFANHESPPPLLKCSIDLFQDQSHSLVLCISFHANSSHSALGTCPINCSSGKNNIHFK